MMEEKVRQEEAGEKALEGQAGQKSEVSA
jgi:hypothetical protein